MSGRQFGKATAPGESVKVLTAADFANSADPGVPAAQGLYDPARPERPDRPNWQSPRPSKP